jgi:predicted Zn-dependent peptidase
MRCAPGLLRWSVGLTAVWTLGVGLSLDAQERFRRTPPLAETRQDLRLEPIESFDMANGLRVAVALRPRSPLVTVQMIIGAGEADSPASLPGVASVTARMIGRGTKVLSGDQINDLIESLGADFSATVLMDYTVFKMEVLEVFLDRALLAMRMMLLEPAFSERVLATVKRNAYYEQLDRKKDPEFLGWGHLLRLLFHGHPYQSAVYSEEVIKFIGSKDVQAFYNRFYMPGNAVVAVSGDVDPPAIARRIGEHFGAWAGRELPRAPVPPPTPNQRERICFVENSDSQEATIFAGNVIMDPTAPEYFPFLVLNQALGGTTRSRLFMNLRESKGFAYYAFSEAAFYRSCGVYWARARVTPEFIHPSVIEIMKELQAFSSERAPAAEIEEAKAYLVGNLPLKLESLEDLSEWTARLAGLGLNSGHWNRALENIMVVNAEKVQAAGQKYLSATPLVVIVGRREWILDSLRDFRVVEIYDVHGVLKQTILKGEDR